MVAARSVCCNFSLAFYCTTCNSTVVIQFRLTFQPGTPIFEQVVYAAKKAILGGQLKAGEPFPSVRALSRELKINPNTAHKVVTHLINEGLLETHPGIGTVVSERRPPTDRERARLLDGQLEQVVVESRRLNLSLEEVLQALREHWTRLDKGGQA